MAKIDLYDKLLETYELGKEFSGFSPESTQFFDNYPLNIADSPRWWDQQKTDYEEFLKPEFRDLLECIIAVVAQFDSGIETEVSKCVGNTHDMSFKPIPYRWAALHSRGADKRIDVQFFINLTSIGLRVGIYSGHHVEDSQAWNARQKRIHSKRNEIFEQYMDLSSREFEMLHTTKQDHASKSSGTQYCPKDENELYTNIAMLRQIGFVKTLDIRKMNGNEIAQNLLRAFSDTRKVYQLLQSSKYSSYKRDLL